MDNEKKTVRFPEIAPEKFRFVQADAKLHDVKFENKPVGYLKDAFRRFCKNRSSVVAAIIIAVMLVFSFIAPWISSYGMSEAYGMYAKCRPVNHTLGFDGFWDGGYERTLNDRYLIYLYANGIGAEEQDGSRAAWESGLGSDYASLISVGDEYDRDGTLYRDVRIDSYREVGFQYLSVTKDQLASIGTWQEETGKPVLFPMVDTSSRYCDEYNRDNANYWYRHDAKSRPLDEDGAVMELDRVAREGLCDNYLRDAEGNVVYWTQRDSNMLLIRVLYYNYYQYVTEHEPSYFLGVDAQGYDILIRIAAGIRFSFLLAIAVSLVNFIVGTVYGAIEGYYGGLVDLIGERISDVVSGIPFIVSCVLVKLHFVNTGKMDAFGGLVFAFFVTGWIGQAYLVRTQFYRFKNQEYILAARTLGAKDGRLMFKHIFPNAIGTIVTSCALDIPSVILSESTLSFLGIYNFNSRTLTSLGTMLGDGQSYLSTYPHILLFPALAISLLMISFNLFGNGLRDAFNPTLRGSEE